MITIGLDIGSTTISAVAMDTETHRELASVTEKHRATLVTDFAWEYVQDPERLTELGCKLISELSSQYGEVVAIGLSGQMHGMLYVDDAGQAVSQFYTWQDHRASLADANGLSLLDAFLDEKHPLIRDGYGLATHLWNLRHGNVPAKAQRITTICGYMAMKLTGANAPPEIHPSEAAAWGFYCLKQNCLDVERLQRLDVDAAMLPCVSREENVAGYTATGIPVYCGLGDNQASFLGSVEDADQHVLLNIGTGSQITRKLGAYTQTNACELRPFINGEYIAVGSGLCGGRAFALLETFIRSCASLAGVEVGSVYDQMTLALRSGTKTDLQFDTTFCGTRQHPQKRACITNLSPENFTAEHFVRAVLRGIVEELHQYYQELAHLSDKPITKVFCSGNLVRLTPGILDIVQDVFELPAEMPPVQEEAAYGAALYAARRFFKT